MSFKFECPKCHQHYEADEQYLNTKLECVSCHETFRVSPQIKKSKFHNKILLVSLFILLVLLACCYGILSRHGNRPAHDLQGNVDFTYTIYATNPTMAKSIAGYYAVTEAVNRLEKREILCDEIPSEIEDKHSRFIVDENLIKEKENQYQVTVTIDIGALKSYTHSYWQPTRIESRDISQLFSRRQQLENGLQEIDRIFSENADQIYSGVRKGMFEVGEKDSSANYQANFEMTYELRFNENAYQKFEQRLKNLLAKIAVAQTSGTTEKYDNLFIWWNNGFLSKFNKSESSQSWPTGTKTIAFVTELGQGQSRRWNYHFFAVPNQVYQKINGLTSDFGVIVFEFQLANREQPLKGYRKLEISFFFEPENVGRNTLVFRNWMWIDNNNDRLYTSAHEFKTVWKFSEDQIRALKSCTLKVYTGQQAEYIWYTSAKRSEYEIGKLANQGYLPAMIALAEQFDEKNWYHNAALMGSRHARQKIAWNNGGLGFEIRPTQEGFMVWAAQKGCPVKKGMILKSINGTEVPKYTNELSKLIGAFSPDESVNVEFTNGKKFDLSVQAP